MTVKVGRLKFTWLHPADPHRGFFRNRYFVGDPWETTIGVAFYWGRRGFGVTWRSPVSPNEWVKQGKVEV